MRVRRACVFAAGTTLAWVMGPACVSPAPVHQSAVSQPAASQPADIQPIYDEKADGNKLIDEALSRAKRDFRRVLIVFGFNRCPWCQRLHRLFETDPAIHKTLLYEYDVVPIDIKNPLNEPIHQRYGNPGRYGFPVLVVLDADGKPLTTQETGSLEEGQGHNPQKVLAFLERWKPQPPAAEATLNGAIQRAGDESKRLLLCFGAPWCPYCHKLDAYLVQESVQAILSKHFVTAKIDVDRMGNGRDVMSRYRGPGDAGLPYFVILDSRGTTVANSVGAEGNIGYPVTPSEVATFRTMLKTAAPGLTDQELATLITALTAPSQVPREKGDASRGG